MIGSGETVREYKTLKKSKSMCIGCHCNFYNSNNDRGIKECWNFKDAKVADKLYYPNHNSYDWQRVKVRTLNCFRY